MLKHEFRCKLIEINFLESRATKDSVGSLLRKIHTQKWSMPHYEFKDSAGHTLWMRRQGSMSICHQGVIKLLSLVMATRITRWYAHFGKLHVQYFNWFDLTLQYQILQVVTYYLLFGRKYVYIIEKKYVDLFNFKRKREYR